MKEIASMAAGRAMRGGVTGAAAQVVNVLTLMGLRTTMNYQMAKVSYCQLCTQLCRQKKNNSPLFACNSLPYSTTHEYIHNVVWCLYPL